jgi:Peptidase family S64
VSPVEMSTIELGRSAALARYALVRDSSGVLHILSNNHVLARTNQAALGEDVSQPGMIDNGCRIGEVVAELSAYASLGSSNVDAAIAALRAGAMATNGDIIDIGIPSGTTVAPAVGLAVAKSGRTTGLTTGSIGAINANVNVQYQQGCGGGRKFVVSYTNQIVVNSSTFSAGGDSGSLIVTDTTDHNPVGLLFAGSSTTTIANPIGDVLTQVGTALGKTVSFNLTGPSSGPALETESALTPAEISRATRAKDAHAPRLMSDPGVVAVGVGQDEQNPGRAAVVIYLQRGLARAAIARELDGVGTRIIETDPIVAFGWNESIGRGCQTP